MSQRNTVCGKSSCSRSQLKHRHRAVYGANMAVTSSMLVTDGRASQQLLGQIFVFCCPLRGSEGWTLLARLPNTSHTPLIQPLTLRAELIERWTRQNTSSCTETTHKQQLHHKVSAVMFYRRQLELGH